MAAVARGPALAARSLLASASGKHDDLTRSEAKSRPTEDSHDVLRLKILLIGLTGVGKSSLLMRFAEDTFIERHVKTLADKKYTFRTPQLDGKTVVLEIWDTGGQMDCLNRLRHEGSTVDGIIFVYDVTNKMSFDKVANWEKEIEDVAVDEILSSANMLLVGNKSDLASKKTVSCAGANELADLFGMQFVETSAKKTKNVDFAFQLLTRDIICRVGPNPDEHENGQDEETDGEEDSFEQWLQWRRLHGCEEEKSQEAEQHVPVPQVQVQTDFDVMPEPLLKMEGVVQPVAIPQIQNGLGEVTKPEHDLINVLEKDQLAEKPASMKGKPAEDMRAHSNPTSTAINGWAAPAPAPHKLAFEYARFDHIVDSDDDERLDTTEESRRVSGGAAAQSPFELSELLSTVREMHGGKEFSKRNVVDWLAMKGCRLMPHVLSETLAALTKHGFISNLNGVFKVA